MVIKKIVFTAFVYFLLCAVQKPSNAEVQVTHMEMQPDMIVGVALWPDGVTPVVDLPVRVWDDNSKRVVYRSRTNKDGVFRIPKVNSGKCYVFVGRVRINLKIMAPDAGVAYQHNDIVIVVPRGMMITARPSMMDIMVIAPAMIAPIEPPSVVSP